MVTKIIDISKKFSTTDILATCECGGQLWEILVATVGPGHIENIIGFKCIKCERIIKVSIAGNLEE